MKKHMHLPAVIVTGVFMILGCNSVTDSETGETKVTPERYISTANNSHAENSTVVPGHQEDDGSIPHGTVNGKYTSVYAWDASDDWYWDLGDGREQGTVGGVDELDESTLTVCDYVVIYRGDFEGTPFMASGWIHNNIKCSGHDYKKTQTFNSLYVHETDPRYSDDLEPIWGTWGILVDTEGGTGNAANPQHPVNN